VDVQRIGRHGRVFILELLKSDRKKGSSKVDNLTLTTVTVSLAFKFRMFVSAGLVVWTILTEPSSAFRFG